MIVTDRFVFLHLHKSGGTFVNEALLRFLPDARQIGYHLPSSMIPPEFAARPVLGLVRSPWSYYVSWYSFQRQRPRQNALFQVLSEQGRLDFAGTLRNLLAIGTDERLHASVGAALPAAYGTSGLNLPGFALDSLRGSGMGFYSWLHRYLYGTGGANVRVVRMEEMRERLPAALESAGCGVSAPLLEYLREAPARNRSEHAPYREYYDAASCAEVASRDAEVIDRYGYAF